MQILMLMMRFMMKIWITATPWKNDQERRKLCPVKMEYSRLLDEKGHRDTLQGVKAE